MSVRRPGIFTITLYDHELLTLQWLYKIDTFSPKVRYTRSPIAVMLLLWKWIAIKNNISPKEQVLETSLKWHKNALELTITCKMITCKMACLFVITDLKPLTAWDNKCTSHPLTVWTLSPHSWSTESTPPSPALGHCFCHQKYSVLIIWLKSMQKMMCPYDTFILTLINTDKLSACTIQGRQI